MPAQLADDQFHLRAVAIETRKRMDHQHVIGMVRVAGTVDHGLEGRAAIVGGGQARLDIFIDDGPALARAKVDVELALGGQADIVFGLAARRHAQIERGPQGGGRDLYPGIGRFSAESHIVSNLRD